jgi:arginine decarboxylase
VQQGDLLSDPKKEIRPWTIKDAAELYNISGWSSGYFRIGSNGNLEVTAQSDSGPSVDLNELDEDLKRRGLGLPILMRFSYNQHSRNQTIVGSYREANQ